MQYAGIREEHLAVRTNAGVFDVSHMGEVETRGPDALKFLQHVLSNDLRRMPEGGAQYSVMCKEDGGVLDDLFTYRLADCEFLTVTNAANHDKDLAWLQEQAGGFDVDVIDAAAKFAMLAVQGPNARRLVHGLTDGNLPSRFHVCQRTVAGVPMLVCGTGYTGEDGVELLLDPEHAPVVWDALLEAGAAPVGLGARDTLRMEVCFHLYGNDLSEERGPIEAGLGWCCKEADGLHRLRSDRPSASGGDGREARPVRDRGAGHRAPGQPGDRWRRGDQRHVLTVSGARHRDGVRFEGPREARNALRDRRAWPDPARGRRAQASIHKGSLDSMADASYPDDLKYHPEHDWARIDGDSATFGITWYAQDALGEVVFYDAPEVGATISKDQAYTEVESVKAVSDVIAPLSGEVIAINDVLADKPETINEDPYGDGWLVRVKLSDPSEADSLTGCDRVPGDARLNDSP